jgi:hypothetical protein
MQRVKHAALYLLAAAVLAGCNATVTKPAASHVVVTNPPTANACILQSGGAPVLKLATPDRATCKTKDGMLAIHTPKYDLEYWLVPGAKTVDEAVPRVPTQIAEEFKSFKATQTTDLTIAGSPAKRLQGAGNEADDGDPGEADVIVFKVGDRIFVACNHGEGLSPAGHQGLLTVTQSAQRP